MSDRGDEEDIEWEARSIETEDMQRSDVSSLLAGQSTVKMESGGHPGPAQRLLPGSLDPRRESVP